MTDAASSPAANPTARRRGLTLIAAAVALVGIGWGGCHWLQGRHHQTTDNAYVAGNVVQITPQVGGTVVAILADDNDVVKAGQPLVKLDTADAKVALDQAEAQLAQTVREVKTMYAGNATLKAQVALREADLARTQADLAKAQDDVNRRAPLVAESKIVRHPSTLSPLNAASRSGRRRACATPKPKSRSAPSIWTSQSSSPTGSFYRSQSSTRRA